MLLVAFTKNNFNANQLSSRLNQTCEGFYVEVQSFSKSGKNVFQNPVSLVIFGMMSGFLRFQSEI